MIWNTAVPVVDLVEAASAEDAIADLGRRLRIAGFEVYDGALRHGPHAFEDAESVPAALDAADDS